MKNTYKMGYKTSPLGRIPDDWDVNRVVEVADIKGGYAFDSSRFQESGRYQVVKMSNLYENDLDLARSKSFLNDITQQEKEFLLSKGDILITLTGTVGKKDYGYSYQINGEKNLLLNQRVAKITARKNFDHRYLYYAVKTTTFLNQFFLSARGGTGNQANVGTVDLATLKVLSPPLREQAAIANLLSTWDKAINTLTQLIAQKELRKKWLMQQLLTGKKRLKGFKGEWKREPLSVHANEVSTRNKENADLTVLSCTKYGGLVPSLEYFGRRVFADDLSTYKVVPKNHFAYATNHIEEGSIGYQSRFKEGLISPMYTVFKTRKELNDEFLYLVLKSHVYIHEYRKRMEGSIDRRGGLRWEEFSKIKIPVLPMDEQDAIADFFNLYNKEQELLTRRLDQIKEQKKGLMQLLLTGKKRLKH